MTDPRAVLSGPSLRPLQGPPRATLDPAVKALCRETVGKRGWRPGQRLAGTCSFCSDAPAPFREGTPEVYRQLCLAHRSYCRKLARSLRLDAIRAVEHFRRKETRTP